MHEDESQETKFNLNPLYHDLEFKLTKPLVEYFLLEKYLHLVAVDATTFGRHFNLLEVSGVSQL